MSIRYGQRLSGRLRRRIRSRKKISGTVERPRLNVFRSTKHIYAQIIDDEKGATLVSASSLVKDLRGIESEDKIGMAKKVGSLIAERCKEKNISQVVFDRNGYRYHGRIKAVADGAREGGLEF